ncbi:MAG: hypothetical protein V1888_00140 [archaeon]
MAGIEYFTHIPKASNFCFDTERDNGVTSSTQNYVNGLVEMGIDNPKDLIDYTRKYNKANPDARISYKMAARLCDRHKGTKNNNLSNMILNSGAVFNSGIFNRHICSK